MDDKGATKIYSCSVFEVCAATAFHKDGKRVYIMTNKGTDFIGLALLDVETGNTELLESDPLKHVDLDRPLFSEKLQELIGTSYVEDRTRIYWRNAEREAEYKRIKAQISGHGDRRHWNYGR